MKVFLYEFISGGGCFHPSIGEAPQGSLLAEGLAMWEALYCDFARISGVQVVATRDRRLPPTDYPVVLVDRDDLPQLRKLASQCDYALVVAPEFDNHLFDRVSLLEQSNCRLLGPDSEFIALCSDKTRTVEWLAKAGLRTPAGTYLHAGQSIGRQTRYPAVVKVNDGAGSMASVVDRDPGVPFAQAMRIEEKVNGVACSQSFLCWGTQAALSCPPLRQRISNDGELRYLGGDRKLSPQQYHRASQLARTAIEVLPSTLGYVGIDMILGDADDGTKDYVIEVNPRITTSYIGLRKLTHCNLAHLMIEAVSGATAVAPQFESCGVQFFADGRVSP